MSMRWYVVKRLLWAVFATYLALSVTFGLLQASPNQQNIQDRMRCAQQGLPVEQCLDPDESYVTKYKEYVVGMFTLNWGYSQRHGQPVTTVLANAWPQSAQYAIPAILISLIIGYGIGLYSAAHQYTKMDYFGSFLAYFGLAVPNFWFAIVLILIFGVWMRDASLFGYPLDDFALPVYYQTAGVDMFSMENVRQLILPTFVVTTGWMAGQMRQARAQALEHMNAEFVKVAKAKGASEYRLLMKHVFRVALVPLATYLVGSFVALLWAGTVITETIFQIPGIGYVGYKAIVNQNTPLIMATTLIPVFLAIVGNLLQDIAYVVLDPRIDYGDR